MFKYRVKIRESYGIISKEAQVINGNTYYFVPSGYIVGGHAGGELKMVPADDEYPENGPTELSLGDLELL